MHAIMQQYIKSAWHEKLTTAQRKSSYRCAIAILGGRFADIRSASCHPDFREAVPALVSETMQELKADDDVISAAQFCESERQQEYIEAFVKLTGKDPNQHERTWRRAWRLLEEPALRPPKNLQHRTPLHLRYSRYCTVAMC